MTVPTQQNPNQPDASRHFPATRSRVRQVGARENQVARKRHKYLFLLIVIYYYYQCCRAGIFWSEPVWRSGSTLNKTEEILNDILFVCSHIDLGLIKKQILKINEFILAKKVGCAKNNFKWLNAYFFYELEPESEPDHSSATLVWTWISYPTHGLHVLRNTPFRKEITPGQALLIEYELFYSFLNKVTTSINSNSTHQRVTHVLCTQVLPITV